MQTITDRKAIAKKLQAEINAIQGLGKPLATLQRGFEPFASAFPEGIFPMAAIHEFISYEPEEAASTTGFISALASKFVTGGGICLWIANNTKVFAAGLTDFGIKPDRIVFINASKPKDALWAIEEALKCNSLAAVIGEIKELGFTESRRLQLAVEQSGVTGFIHRNRPFRENAVACTTRWKITPVPSFAIDGLPGIGFASWNVELLKVRNGKPDSWQLAWNGESFGSMQKAFTIQSPDQRNAG